MLPFACVVAFRGMLRLVKLTRLSRMARVLRSVPELAIIVILYGDTDCCQLQCDFCC